MSLIGNRKYEIDCYADYKALEYKVDLSHRTEIGLAVDERDLHVYFEICFFSLGLVFRSLASPWKAAQLFLSNIGTDLCTYANLSG